MRPRLNQDQVLWFKNSESFVQAGERYADQPLRVTSRALMAQAQAEAGLMEGGQVIFQLECLDAYPDTEGYLHRHPRRPGSNRMIVVYPDEITPMGAP